jgi:hypothetical protein
MDGAARDDYGLDAINLRMLAKRLGAVKCVQNIRGQHCSVLCALLVFYVGFNRWTVIHGRA